MFESLDGNGQDVRLWRAPVLHSSGSVPGALSRLAGSSVAAPSDGAGNLSGETSGTSAELLQSSYDEGYAAGYAEGNAAASAEAVKRVASLIAAIEEAHAADTVALEAEVVELARAMVRLILKREVEHDASMMRGIVRGALEQLPGKSQHADVYLHPLDAAVVRPLMAGESAVRIIDDAELERGGCRVQSRASVIDAGIDAMVAAIASELD